METKIECLADLHREQAQVERQIKSKEVELKAHLAEVNDKIQPLLNILGKFGFGKKQSDADTGIIGTVLKTGIPAIIGALLLKQGGKLAIQAALVAIIPIVIAKIKDSFKAKPQQ